MPAKTGNKATYFDKLKGLLEQYNSIFMVNVDNVSSQQMHEIRVAIRGKGVILMGKNTMVRRAIKTFVSDIPDCASLLPHIKGNIGFVFTNTDLKEMREQILQNRVAAPARAGAVAPADVYVPAGNTGMEPGKTSFFQALGVPTKIARGTIEITSDVLVCQAGSKVGASEATLLNMLNISPFTYGMSISQIYDGGVCFHSDVLDIEEEQLLKSFHAAIAAITNISLAITYPTLPSVIHSLLNSYKNLLGVAAATDYEWPGIAPLKARLQEGVFWETMNKVLNAYKNMLAIGLQTEYSWPLFEQVKEQLLNPTAAPASSSAPAAESAPAAKEEAKPAEEEEEEDEDMGFGLFD